MLSRLRKASGSALAHDIASLELPSNRKCPPSRIACGVSKVGVVVPASAMVGPHSARILRARAPRRWWFLRLSSECRRRRLLAQGKGRCVLGMPPMSPSRACYGQSRHPSQQGSATGRERPACWRDLGHDGERSQPTKLRSQRHRGRAIHLVSALTSRARRWQDLTAISAAGVVSRPAPQRWRGASSTGVLQLSWCASNGIG